MNIMNENLELLEYIYQNSSMGVYTLNRLIKELNGKDNKIKKHVEEQIKGYEEFLKKTEKLIKKNKYEVKDNNFMAKMGATFSIKMDTMKDNSDASIAHMLVQGITMGLVDIETKISNYKESAKSDILDIAKDFKKFSEEKIEELKRFM